MPLRSGLLSFKAGGLSRFKSRKQAKTPRKTPRKMAIDLMVMAGMQGEGNADSVVYRLQNFDLLVKRLNKVFLLYQVSLSEGRPIVFDEVRCNHALDLRLLLSVKATDLLESDRMVSNLELHNLGLRLPENPLNANPVHGYDTKIRKAFREELGTIYINTALEILGLVTVLHVLERAVCWLEPLLSSKGFRHVQINVAAALQLPIGLSQTAANPRSLGSGISDQTRVRRQSTIKSTVRPRTDTPAAHWQAPEASLRNTVLSPKRDGTKNLRADIELPREFSAYNFGKELPTNALDRWVVEARSCGHEPTVMECTNELKKLEADYELYKHKRGYPPPPISARYGYIDHALRRQYQEPRITHQISPASLRALPEQQQMTFKQEAEMLVAAATDLRHRVVPQERNQPVVNTSKGLSIGRSMLNRSHSDLAMLATSKTASTSKTPRRRLLFTGSPIKHKNRPQMKIGTPSNFTHEASGAGLESWDEMTSALKAVNESSNHSPLSDSIPKDLHSHVRSSHNKSAKARAGTPGSRITIKRRTSTVRYRSPPRYGGVSKIQKQHTNKVANRAVSDNTAFGGQVEPEVRVESEQQHDTSLEDQNAKVEALLVQLLLMQDVFIKARDSLASSVGSQFIEKVTDIAVAYGWFRANSTGITDNKPKKGNRIRGQ